MYKTEVLTRLEERKFTNGIWLCSPTTGKQILKLGACSSLYKQLNCRMTVGIHAVIEYQVTRETERLAAGGNTYAPLTLSSLRYTKLR